jgi:hypothetical protein
MRPDRESDTRMFPQVLEPMVILYSSDQAEAAIVCRASEPAPEIIQLAREAMSHIMPEARVWSGTNVNGVALISLRLPSHLGIGGFDETRQALLADFVRPRYALSAEGAALVIHKAGATPVCLLELRISGGRLPDGAASKVQGVPGVAEVKLTATGQVVRFKLPSPSVLRPQPVAEAVAALLGVYLKGPIQIMDPKPMADTD